MIFVTADNNRSRLEHLTKLLISAFPGSTIYQHVNPLRVAADVLHHRVSAVFLEADMKEIGGIDLLQMLRRQEPDVPVFILSRDTQLRDQAAEFGASGFLLHPVGMRQITDALSGGAETEGGNDQ